MTARWPFRAEGVRQLCAFIYPSRRRCKNTAVRGDTCRMHTTCPNCGCLRPGDPIDCHQCHHEGCAGCIGDRDGLCDPCHDARKERHT